MQSCVKWNKVTRINMNGYWMEEQNEQKKAQKSKHL